MYANIFHIFFFFFLSFIYRPSYVMFQFSAHEKSSTSMHLEELDDPQKFADEGVKVITWQEYVSRLHELKDEITRSWLADDRVTSLKLTIKVKFDVFNKVFCNIMVCRSENTFSSSLNHEEIVSCFQLFHLASIGFYITLI